MLEKRVQNLEKIIWQFIQELQKTVRVEKVFLAEVLDTGKLVYPKAA